MKEIFNFSAGPAMLPKQIMQQIKNELYDWNNLKISVMEISHRSNEFIQLANDIDKDIRFLLKIPKNYKVLFCQGGARAQFSAIPMNLLNSSKDIVDYINTGYWSYYAAMEAKKYCSPRLINVCEKNNGIYSIKPMDQWNVSLNSTYIHYCPNETINGISIDEQPIFSKNKILIADCSSTLFSKPLDISRFGIVYAAAQKNIGLSGLTLVIIREDLLLKKSKKEIPSILNYQVLSKYNSMFNTPVTFSWYVAGLMFKWLRTQGGLEKINLQNQKKSSFLYKEIDCNSYYYNNVDVMNRSKMNIPFFLKNKNLEACFLNESRRFGLYGLQGHKAIGGVRASLYNSMPLVGVKKLVEFMRNFSKKKS